MEKSNTKILIDEKGRISLESTDLSVSHISTDEEYEEMLAFYKKNNLTSILTEKNVIDKNIINLGCHYTFKDENKNIFGIALMTPINIIRTTTQMVPLFVYLPSEQIYEKLFEFMCYTAKHLLYKRLIITVYTYEEYDRLLKIGFIDMPPEHLNSIKGNFLIAVSDAKGNKSYLIGKECFLGNLSGNHIMESYNERSLILAMLTLDLQLIFGTASLDNIEVENALIDLIHSSEQALTDLFDYWINNIAQTDDAQKLRESFQDNLQELLVPDGSLSQESDFTSPNDAPSYSDDIKNEPEQDSEQEDYNDIPD